MTTAIYKETFRGDPRSGVTRHVELKADASSVDKCRRKMIEKIKAESKRDSDTHKSECKPQPNVTVLREELESAQARLLKLEAQARNGLLNLLAEAQPSEAALEAGLKAALDDIKAAKSLLAEAINAYPVECEEEDDE